MNRNFLRFFSRNFIKHGWLNAVNILGLSLGFSAAFLIVLYVDHEYNHDSFHKDVDRIYRFEGQTNSDMWFSNLGMEHALELTSGTYPEVEAVVRYNAHQGSFVIHNNERFAEKTVYQTEVESKFFELFNFPFVQGNPEDALSRPYQMVLTKTLAQKYFGTLPAIGQTLTYDSTLYTVSGVVEDLPTHTHFDFNILVTNPDLYKREHFHTNAYIKLVDKSSVESLEQKILSMDVAYNEFHELSAVRLLPVEGIHLVSDAAFGSGRRGDQLQINVFMLLAVLILFIAIVNYINLTFAIFLNKGKEVGVRKVLGETRRQIVFDLSKHAVANTLLTIPFIGLALYFMMPLFGNFMEVELFTVLQYNVMYICYAIVALTIIGLLTVIYPALALRRIDVNSLMKSGLLLTESGGVHYRNILILIQFIFLFKLGISAWFMNQQIKFLDHKDKGFNPENVVKIGNAYEIGSYENYTLLKNRLLAYSGITGVAFGPMMGDGMNPLSYKPEGSDEIYENLLSYGVGVDYFDVMGITIVEGEFKRKLSTSENGFIVSLVNQSFIDRYGWNDDPIGKKIVLRPGTENELNRQVSAVFKDFHFFSFKEKIAPQIISLRPDPQFVNTNILIKSVDADINQTLKIIESEWAKIQPDLPIELSMMTHAVQKMYSKERQTGLVGVTLSLLAITLSVMGIVGFMFYILGLKSREIAIRKVLGASVTQIVGLLNKQLFYTILIAAAIGSAGSYWLVAKWLQDYAYAIQIGPFTFISFVILVYLIVFIVVGFQTLKSTRINPVVVLKEK